MHLHSFCEYLPQTVDPLPMKIEVDNLTSHLLKLYLHLMVLPELVPCNYWQDVCVHLHSFCEYLPQTVDPLPTKIKVDHLTSHLLKLYLRLLVLPELVPCNYWQDVCVHLHSFCEYLPQTVDPLPTKIEVDNLVKKFLNRYCIIIILDHTFNVTDIKDLNEVILKLHPEAIRWKEIGLVLGISLSNLNIIKHNNSTIEERLRDMVTNWLNRVDGVSTSWQILHEAVRNPTGGNNPALADTI